MDNFPEIEDSICVSQYSKDGRERAVLFLQMKSGYAFNQDLVKRLQTAITQALSVRHVPEVILETGGIPVSSKFYVFLTRVLNLYFRGGINFVTNVILLT